MRLGVTLPMFGAVAPAGGWRRLLEIARHADGAGIDRIVVVDHVVLGAGVDDYPWGRFPTGPGADWLAPLPLLAAVAAVTERVRLATSILIAPLRPAVVLAKDVATIDVLSGGRVDLGVGTGWHEAEFRGAGVPFADRGRALTDTVAACRRLWEDAPASFASPTASFDELWCRPAPAQARLPVWFSGSLTPRNVRRIVTLGDGWIPIMGSDLDAVAAGRARLRDELAAAGRDPDDLRIAAPLPAVAGDPAATLAGAAALVAAGATDLHVALRSFVGADLTDAEAALDALAAARP